MLKVLVTGGSGFMGRHLCHELRHHGYDVVVFDRSAPEPTYDYVAGDIRHAGQVRKAVQGCDGIFHLAGLLGTEELESRPRDAIDANVGGAINVFEAAVSSGAFVVNVGLVPAWPNAYMITKKAAAQLGLMFHRSFGARITTFELTHVYGPGQTTARYRKAIPTFIDRALHGAPLEVFGDGSRIMDCLYVTDAVRGLRIGSQCSVAFGTINTLCSGERISVLDLARTVKTMAGSKSHIVHLPMRRGEPAAVSPDEILIAGSPIPWRAETCLREGLERTIEYYRSRASVGDSVAPSH